MKRSVFAVLGVVVLAGAVLALNRPRVLPVAPAEPVAEPAAVSAGESAPKAEPAAPSQKLSAELAPHPAETSHRSEPAAASLQAAIEKARLNGAVDILVSPQAPYEQKQTAWKQLRDAGNLDLAISELEQRVAANPRVAEYPAALGQAYLKKCATLQDVREQGILAIQADKLFDTALELDPANWEARFIKAVAMSYWPASMNKGEEVIQHFETLIRQQETQPPQPHFASSYVWLGDQFQKSGRPDEARTIWERGASLFPNDEGLRKKLAAPIVAPSAAPAGGQ